MSDNEKFNACMGMAFIAAVLLIITVFQILAF